MGITQYKSDVSDIKIEQYIPNVSQHKIFHIPKEGCNVNLHTLTDIISNLNENISYDDVDSIKELFDKSATFESPNINDIKSLYADVINLERKYVQLCDKYINLEKDLLPYKKLGKCILEFVKQGPFLI